MKRVISIILVLVLCLGCCFALTACSDSDKTDKPTRRHVTSGQKEVAKANFSTVMESYNGYVTIKNKGMDITEKTTIQDVIDFLSNNDFQIVAIDHLNTSLPFLSACKADGGYYVISNDVDWADYYAEQ